MQYLQLHSKMRANVAGFAVPVAASCDSIAK